MKKDIIIRFWIGLSFGELIGIIVNVIISLGTGNGEYIAAMPQLVSYFDNEISAVIVQYVLVGAIGVVFAESSMIFNIESWSFLKKCMVHFLISVVFYIPFVYLCYMPQNLKSVIIMLINFVFTYALTWFIQYKVNCNDVKQINERIQEVLNNERYRDK